MITHEDALNILHAIWVIEFCVVITTVYTFVIFLHIRNQRRP